MPNHIRRDRPGGTFVFTVVTYRCRHLFGMQRAGLLLRETVLGAKEQRPFTFLFNLSKKGVGLHDFAWR